MIGVYLLETEDGLALQDCGPSTCIRKLKEQLAERALVPSDVRHCCFAHPPRPRRRRGHSRSGAIRASGARSEWGAAPRRSRRGSSRARAAYGDDFDRLWGELAPVPEENVHVVGSSVLGLRVLPAAPGHAGHHVCYVDGAGTIYTGDAAGVRILPERPVLARLSAARDRPRRLGAHDRRARGARTGAARAHPLRRR